MDSRPRFKPEITRIKLNPEQAVLACPCAATGRRVTSGPNDFSSDGVSHTQICGGSNRGHSLWQCAHTGPTANRQRTESGSSSS